MYEGNHLIVETILEALFAKNFLCIGLTTRCRSITAKYDDIRLNLVFTLSFHS